jgi:hypothetical protein
VKVTITVEDHGQIRLSSREEEALVPAEPSASGEPLDGGAARAAPDVKAPNDGETVQLGPAMSADAGAAPSLEPDAQGYGGFPER